MNSQLPKWTLETGNRKLAPGTRDLAPAFCFLLSAFCLLPSAFAQNLPTAQIFNRVYLPTSLSLNANPGLNPNPLNCISNPKTLTQEQILNCVYDPTNKALYLHLLDPVVPTVTVATLPSSPPAGTLRWVSNGASATDCTVGGGSTRVLCAYSGSAWSAVGGGGGGGGSGTVTSVGLAGTTNQITVTGTSPITTSGSWTLSFPSAGVTLPGTTSGTFSGNLTGNAATASALSGAKVFYAALDSGADFCAKVADGWSYFTGLNASGGIVDATGLTGAQTCAGSMFANYPTNATFNGKVIGAPGTTVVTAVTQTLPNGAIIDGQSGHPFVSATTTPFPGFVIQASNSFNWSNGPLIAYGASGSGGVPMGQQLRNLGLSCLSPNATFSSSSVGISDTYGEQWAGAENVIIDGCDVGIAINTTNAVASGPWKNIQVDFTDVTDVAGHCVEYGTAGGSIPSPTVGFEGLTCNHLTGSTGAAVLVDGPGFYLNGGNFQGFAVGVEVGANAAASGVSLNNVMGLGFSGNAMTSVIDISASNNSDVVATNITGANTSYVTNAIADHRTNGYTITLAQVPYYSHSVDNCVLSGSYYYPSRGCGQPTVAFTSTANSTSPSTEPVWSPTDPTQFMIYETWPPNSTSAGQIGILGWNDRAISGSATAIAYCNSTSPNLGCMTQSTDGTAGHGTAIDLDQGTHSVLGVLSLSGWVMQDVFQLGQTSNNEWRSGAGTAGTAQIVPNNGIYVRADQNLKNVASATCNDAGNKCGLTTLTGTTGQTVTFSINGGTATGSVALTGTNAIANGTSITVTAAGGGYNSTGGAAVGTVTGGTATATGSIALTTTLGAAASGPDSDFMLCVGHSSVEYCYDTGVGVDTNWHRVQWYSRTFTSTQKLGGTFYSASGAVQLAEKFFCSSGCDVTATIANESEVPINVLVSLGAATITANYNLFAFHVWGLAR